MAQDTSNNMSWAFVIRPTRLSYPASCQRRRTVVMRGWLASSESLVNLFMSLHPASFVVVLCECLTFVVLRFDMSGVDVVR